MYLDARELPTGHRLSADVCIVGAGAAGIALAHELARHDLRTLLVESGGFAPTRTTRRLSKGERTGEAHRPLETVRSRLFGGTTHDWKGGCVPLEPLDFERREWVPHSGWPIDRERLDPYYRRASSFCGVAPEATPVPELPAPLAARVVQYSPFPRFGEHYRGELERSPGLSVCLHANLVRIDAADQHRVSGLELATVDGTRLRVDSRFYVLAAGGIENARLLLLSSGAGGLRFENDLLGRCYATHPRVLEGVLRADPEPLTSFFESSTQAGVRLQTELHLTADILRHERLLNMAAVFVPTVRQAKRRGAASLLYIAQALRRGYLARNLARHLGSVLADLPGALGYTRRRLLRDYPPHRPAELFRLHLQVEQVPNPDSRVTLSSRRDRFGLPRVRLEWHPTELDWSSARRSLEIFGDALAGAGLGRLESPFRGDDSWRSFLIDTAHHIGTTRMHSDPRQGVVDPDGRLHAVENLYVTGSSVFPTAGVARPTLTIIALALRLADHLVDRLG